MWIILLIVLAGILAGYSLRMCAFFEKSESDYLVYHLSDAVRVRTFRGLQSVDCRKLGFFWRTGAAAQCGWHYG